jgi:hypothetical protein
MSLQVKIVVAAINTACLIVTLLCPGDVTPLVLLTTIASAVTWAFAKTEQSRLTRKWQFISTSIASGLAIVCIVLGVTASISQPTVPKYAGQFVFTFDTSVVGLAGQSFDYLFFAVTMFVVIVFLMGVELLTSYLIEKSQKSQLPSPQPLARCIKQQLANFT